MNRSTLITLVLASACVAPAFGTPSIQNAFTSRYPTSTLTTRMNSAAGATCYVCHQPPNMGVAGNCYRRDLIARLDQGRTAAQAIADIDGVDSDGDGTLNGAEITAVRTDIAGAVGYNPGLIGLTGTDPCGPNPSAPVTNQRETPAPRCVADVDDGSGTGTPDGGVTIDDLLYYLGLFQDGNVRADVDDGSGTGTPDGGVTIDDLLYFILRFTNGC